ncbi:hypothetical protein ASPZODRAFT_783258 [Penicilliopsis zonata CBS 506.65]|uniref:Uncharacterized protein n=1 Tax=Penicilliopsis zonata CBS 506.65 TaxID=1073090 RepID=A0A1L9SB55_9EURO|nr:hypothetical protein ASPZODRAFT_783258 [Penicilliopsis zonata CBS 506.65]OJJ44388.1 hypothetical protein ASPZODRAFT_783258 [Penicilliopsis zonata CBS 506.65]
MSSQQSWSWSSILERRIKKNKQKDEYSVSLKSKVLFQAVPIKRRCTAKIYVPLDARSVWSTTRVQGKPIRRLKKKKRKDGRWRRPEEGRGKKIPEDDNTSDLQEEGEMEERVGLLCKPQQHKQGRETKAGHTNDSREVARERERGWEGGGGGVVE